MNLASALNTAQTAHSEGDLSLAEQLYLAIIKDHDNNDAIYGLATLYYQQQQYAQAITLFEKIQDREPHAADIALYYALCLKSVNESTKALVVITTILPHIPNNVRLIMPFAQLTFSLASYPLTIKLLTLYPLDSPQIKSLLASTYLKTEQWLQAQKIYLELVKITPEDPVLWNNIAISSAKIRDYKQAVHAFSTFINNAESNSNNHLRFADLYLLAKDAGKAREQLNIAISLQDSSLIRYELETRICRLENNYPLAIIAANKAIDIDGDNTIAWQAKSELAKESDLCITKLNCLQNEGTETNYKNQQNLYTLAKAYENEANFEQAFDCFSKANNMQKSQLILQNLVFDEQKNEHEFNALSKVLDQDTPLVSNINSIPPNNIFIVGMPRSGTTLVDRLLSQDDSVQSSGENEALAFTIEHKINQHQVSKESWSSFFNTHRSTFTQEYHQATSLDSDIIVDKMPHNFRFVGAIIALFKGVRVVQMRRDPQDLALSIFSHAFPLEHNYACDLTAIAHTIYQANKLMDFWAKTFPDQVININYEELAEFPNTVGLKLYNFCQLQWREENLNFYQKNVSSFTFSELQVRQAINTKKINFSANYKQQLSEFNKIYNRLLLTAP